MLSYGVLAGLGAGAAGLPRGVVALGRMAGFLWSGELNPSPGSWKINAFLWCFGRAGSWGGRAGSRCCSARENGGVSLVRGAGIWSGELEINGFSSLPSKHTSHAKVKPTAKEER